MEASVGLQRWTQRDTKNNPVFTEESPWLQIWKPLLPSVCLWRDIKPDDGRASDVFLLASYQCTAPMQFSHLSLCCQTTDKAINSPFWSSDQKHIGPYYSISMLIGLFPPFSCLLTYITLLLSFKFINYDIQFQNFQKLLHYPVV